MDLWASVQKTTKGVFDLKRRCAECSVYDIKVSRERFASLGSVGSLIALAVLWCHTLSILRSAASSRTHLRTLVSFCSKTWPCDALKVDNTGRLFFDKMCLGFRSRYMWRIMSGIFFKSGVYRFLQINSSYIYIGVFLRCVRLEAALRRMLSVWHQSTARAIREPTDPKLANRSRDTLMSYTEHSAQRRFKSNTPFVVFEQKPISPF